jgi:PAS domain S-box-containing protein
MLFWNCGKSMSEFANHQISSRGALLKREDIRSSGGLAIVEPERSPGGTGKGPDVYKEVAVASPADPAIIQGLLEASFDAVYVLDAYGRLLDVNEAACRRHGKNSSELLGCFFWDVAPEAVLRSWQMRIGNVLTSGEGMRFEDELDGGLTESSVLPVCGDAGLPASLIVVSRTITEAGQLERQLRRCEKIFANAQRMAKVGSWDVELNSSKTQWSDELYRILGYAPGEVKPSVDFFTGHIHPDDLEQFLNRSTKHGVGDYNLLGTHAEYRIFARDGSLKWVLGNTEAEYDAAGTICRISGTIQDITARRQMEEALRGSEEKFRSLFMGSGDGIILYDHSWKIIGWNKAMERITGRAEQDFIDKYAWDMAYEFFPEDKKTPPVLDMLKAQHSASLLEKEIAAGEFTMLLRGGASRIISYNTFKIPAGAQVMYGSILRDVTDQKIVEIEQKKLIAELTDALAQIKTLKGLLPICSSCKKIRDDMGYWNTLEKYIMEHSEAEFTHGICPDCIRKYFPEACEDEP